MTDTKISALTSGVPAQDGDIIPAAREISPGVYGNVSLTAASVAARAPAPTPVPSDFQAPILAGGYYTCPLMFPIQDAPQPDNLLAAPFWSSFDVTWSKIGIAVIDPEDGAKVRLGIYASDENNRPGALLLDAGEIDCSTAGDKELDISLTIPANTLVWLASVAQTTEVTLIAWLASGNTGQIGSWGAVVIGAATADAAFAGVNLTRSFSYGALPDPFGDIDGSSQGCPLPYLRTGV